MSPIVPTPIRLRMMSRLRAFGARFRAAGPTDQIDMSAEVDALLDVLTDLQSRDVLRAGCAAGNADQCRTLDVHLVDAGTIFTAMIRAIKEGK